ncbi:SDR family NAD(P)-dependent oxidoreductase, partial [Acinetobacter baumannii]
IGLYVAAAGFGSSGPFVEAALADEIDMIQVNCTAIVELTHAIARQMTPRRRGGIVLFASLVGWQGVPLSATYSATKAFVQSFAEALRVELKMEG